MANITIWAAAIFIIAAIITAIVTDNSWKNVGITWLLLVVGTAFLGITLTL